MADHRVDLDPVRCRIRVVVTGALNPADIVSALDLQAAAGVWRYGVLNDLREVTTLLETADIRRLLAHARALSATHGPRGPIAVVTANEALYGMVRILSTLSEAAALTVGVFRTIDDAERWLDDVMTAEARFYLPTEEPRAPRPPRPAERVWTLEKDSDSQTAQLVDHAASVVELQLTFNGTSYFTSRHETRELALGEAATLRRNLEKDGWTSDS